MGVLVANNGTGENRMFASQPKKSVLCRYWQAGVCNRYPCPFLHGNSDMKPVRPQSQKLVSNKKRSYVDDGVKDEAKLRKKLLGVHDNSTIAEVKPKPVIVNKEQVCKFWKQGNCPHGDKCRFLHQWVAHGGFTMVKQLAGHEKAITGIALPADSNQLLSASKDGSVKIWDCESGEVAAVSNLGEEIGCMVGQCKGPWVFVGVPNSVKAWNSKTRTDTSLDGPVGLVYALAELNDMLFAGDHSGNISGWKCSNTEIESKPLHCFKAHSLPVISLALGKYYLISGSMDNTINVWRLETLEWCQTLTVHTSAVTSLLCYEKSLLSCSLDGTVRQWETTEQGSLEVIHTHTEAHGVLTINGIYDDLHQPVLMCSCNDDTLRLYDLPSFKSRGKIFSKEEIRATEIGPGGLFFTGDGAGELRVWKLPVISPN